MSWFKQAIAQTPQQSGLQITNDRLNVQQKQQELRQLNQSLNDIRQQMSKVTDDDLKQQLTRQEQDVNKRIALVTQQIPVQQSMLQLDQQQRAQMTSTPMRPVRRQQ